MGFQIDYEEPMDADQKRRLAALLCHYWQQSIRMKKLNAIDPTPITRAMRVSIRRGRPAGLVFREVWEWLSDIMTIERDFLEDDATGRDVAMVFMNKYCDCEMHADLRAKAQN